MASVDGEDKNFLETIDTQKTWIITDRHTIINNEKHYEMGNLIKSATVLKMPLSDLLDSALKYNLISCNEKTIDEAFDYVLKKEFMIED